MLGLTRVPLLDLGWGVVACIVIEMMLPDAGSELGSDMRVQFGFGSNLDLGSDRVHGVSSVVIVKVCVSRVNNSVAYHLAPHSLLTQRVLG